MRNLSRIIIALLVFTTFISCGKFLEEGRRKAIDMFDGQAIAVSNQNDSLANAIRSNNIRPDSILDRISAILDDQIRLIKSSREDITAVTQDNNDTETAERVLVESGVIDKINSNVAELEELASKYGGIGENFDEAIATVSQYCDQTKVKDKPCFSEMPAMDAVMILAIWHLQFVEARNDVLKAIVA